MSNHTKRIRITADSRETPDLGRLATALVNLALNRLENENKDKPSADHSVDQVGTKAAS